MPIRISLDSLVSGPRSDSDVLDPAFATERLGADFSVAEPFVVRWKAQRVQTVVQVRAEIRGALSCMCSRCGDLMVLPMTVDLDHHWLPAGELEVEAGEGPDDDPDVSAHDGVAIDVEPVALDILLVEVPLAPACAPGDPTRCARLGDEPIVYFAGDPPPDEPAEKPFASLLAGLRAGAEKPEA